uniref:Uncharacterized protein n=1 Tax=Anguilla anguilla TaxID=7936 RepID=A0A0E9XF87_ANGAN
MHKTWGDEIVIGFSSWFPPLLS